MIRLIFKNEIKNIVAGPKFCHDVYNFYITGHAECIFGHF